MPLRREGRGIPGVVPGGNREPGIREIGFRQERRAGLDLDVALDRAVADPQLRGARDVPSEIHAPAVVDEMIGRDVVAIDVDILDGSTRLQAGFDEEPLGDVEGLVQAGRKQRLIADLQVVAPLAAAVVQPAADMLDAQHELEVAAAVCIESHAGPQDIRSDGHLLRQPDERGGVGIAFQPVPDRLQVLERRHAAGVLADRVDVGRVAGTNGRDRLEVIRIDVIESLDSHVSDPGLDFLAAC